MGWRILRKRIRCVRVRSEAKTTVPVMKAPSRPGSPGWPSPLSNRLQRL